MHETSNLPQSRAEFFLSLYAPGFPSNLGAWFRLGTGLPNVVVYDMQYNATDKVLVVGTMGRSTFLLAANANHPPVAGSLFTMGVKIGVPSPVKLSVANIRRRTWTVTR